MKTINLILSAHLTLTAFFAQTVPSQEISHHQSPYKIVVLTLPKTGSHLLMKCITLLSGREKNHRPGATNWQTQFFWAHPRRGQIQRQFLNNNFRILTIFRDPRDQLISNIRYNFHRVKDLTVNIEDIITAMLMHHTNGYNKYLGYTTGLAGAEGARTIDEMYGPFLSFRNRPNVYIAYFENLVGPLGGGSTEKQLQEIRNIAEFIDIPVSEEEIVDVANNLYGNTFTFKTGRIDSWKKYFTDEHKQLFKKSGQGTLTVLGYEKDLNWT